MIVRTCTKVNIGLNVLRKRPDGYHDLETLFVPYRGFGDVLQVEPADELSIDIVRPEGLDWDPMQDLTVRAWRLLREDFPHLPAVSIHLQKGAPVGAGLGGGSADAAAMLLALNEMGGLGLSDSTLAAYAARLGSDCAFFVYCRPMFATGRGEILEPFDIDLSAYELKVEIPLDAATGHHVAVSTREAYGGIVPRELSSPGAAEGAGATDLRFAHPSQADAWAPPVHVATGGYGSSPQPPLPLREALMLPVDEWRGRVVNDFEASVCPRHPEISGKIEEFYRRGAVYAAMSGSGSAVFGLFEKI